MDLKWRHYSKRIKKSLGKFLSIGEINAQKVFKILFYVGGVIAAIEAYLIGKLMYLTNTYPKPIIRNGQTWFTGEMQNNLTLGIIGGVVSFVILLILWKVVCELLLIIFRCFETYVAKNKE